jgi:large subunit ribosomal protein L1
MNKGKIKSTKKTLPEKIKAKNISEAILKAKEIANSTKRNFSESVDLAVVLGIDAKQSDQSVKGSVLLPHGSGKDVKIVVFASTDEQKKLAIEGGAIFAGLEDLVAKIEGGFYDFDCAIATPDVMQKISKVARKLGPRGLMPSPKNGTVTNDISLAVKNAKKGKVDFKNDKSGIVHCMIGKVNFEDQHLLENINSVIKSIKEAKPESSKGKYIKSFYINTTMGPSIEVEIESI